MFHSKQDPEREGAPTDRGTPSRTDQTREALLAAGTELFAEAGYDGATVEAISRRARVNKALISYHFGGKDGLYQAILLEHFTEMPPLVQAILDSGGSAADRLSRVVTLMRERIERRPTLPAMLLREVVAGGDRLGETALRFMAGMAAAVQRIVQDGVDSGEFRPVDPHQTYLSLIGGLVFFHGTTLFRSRLYERSTLVREPPTAAGYTEHLIALMLRALAPDVPAPRTGDSR